LSWLLYRYRLLQQRQLLLLLPLLLPQYLLQRHQPLRQRLLRLQNQHLLWL
jgi:hypothetical protein